MQMEIKYCNNIKSGTVCIKKNSLNIKYGINGTGKSTVSKAIVYSILDRESTTKKLTELTPFEGLNDDSIEPTVTGTGAIRSVEVFNEDKVNELVFQPNELIKGSFDIFIRDSSYDYGIQEIEKLVTATKALLSSDPEIEALLADFAELSKGFGRPTKSGIHGSSALCKAFKEGNKVSNVPPELEAYTEYIKSDINFKWIKWQLEGKQFRGITESCPYCVSDISSERETIEKVGQVYESKTIEKLNHLVGVFKRLNKYFSDETNQVLDA